MKSIHLRVLAACALAGILPSGCGPNFPPWVETARDVADLPENQKSIRARVLSDQDIHSLMLLPKLEHLDFLNGWGGGFEGTKTTDKGLHYLSGLDLPCLATLFLGFNNNITDEGLRDVASLKHVKTLGLLNCPKLSDRGLEIILSMPSLEYLDLRCSDWVTDHTLEIIEQAKGLKTLCLSGCRTCTPKGLGRLRRARPSPGIDDSEVNNMANWGK